MKTPRAFVIGDPDLYKMLEEQDARREQKRRKKRPQKGSIPFEKRVGFVDRAEDIERVTRDALLIVVNTNHDFTEIPEGQCINPVMLIHLYHQLALNILRGEEDVPVADRPFQPAATIQCDPSDKNSIWRLRKHTHPNAEDLSGIWTPSQLKHRWRRLLLARLHREKHHAGERFALTEAEIAAFLAQKV